jgi:hypothetical protein
MSSPNRRGECRAVTPTVIHVNFSSEHGVLAKVKTFLRWLLAHYLYFDIDRGSVLHAVAPALLMQNMLHYLLTVCTYLFIVYPCLAYDSVLLLAELCDNRIAGQALRAYNTWRTLTLQQRPIDQQKVCCDNMS